MASSSFNMPKKHFSDKISVLFNTAESDTSHIRSYTFNDDGFALITVTFSAQKFSQIFLNLNGFIFHQFTSNGEVRTNETDSIGIPVCNGDVLSVSFYSSYDVNKCELTFLH